MIKRLVSLTIIGLIFNFSFAGDFSSYMKALEDKNLPDSLRIEYCNLLFHELVKLKDEAAIQYGKQLITLLEKKSLPISSELEFKYVKSLIEFGHYNEGNKYANNLYKKYKSKSDYLLMLKAENLVAYQYYRKGYISKAIKYYEVNIKTALKLKFYDYAAHTQYELAKIYSTIGENEKEFGSLKKAYDNFAKAKDKNIEQLIIIQHQLGDIYLNKEEYDKALIYFQNSAKISEVKNDSTWMLKNNTKIARSYYYLGKHKTAYKMFKQLIPLCNLLRDSTLLASSYGYMARILYEEKKSKESLNFYSKAIDIAHKNNAVYNLAWLYKSLSQLFAEEGKYEKAYNYFKKHAFYQEKLKEQEYIKKIGQSELMYMSEKKEKELELLSAKLYENKILTYGLGSGILLFFIIGGLIFYQNRQKNIQRITEMNHKISEITQKNLRQQMNPHFIFNTLNSIQYYMYQNDRISTNNYLTKFSSLMRKTLENSTHTSIPIKDELEALQLYLQLESLRFKDKFTWEINVDEEIDALLYKIPTMLIQPYVENSICHGLSNKDESGYIHIDLKLKEKYIEVTIEDDGIGREKAQAIKKVKNGNQKSLGTKITESRLKLVNTLYGNEMKIHYEDLLDKMGNPAGTRVIINIPIIS